MNFNKGEKTGGRGASFKGALTYYLHDKDTLDTADRVGFVHMVNLVTGDPYGAWREMMLTAESSDNLKRNAGVSLSGAKNEQPVYCFSIEWHPDDRPTKEHMLETALDVLKFMKMDEHQAVIVEHTDTAHRHVHITVNMVHPETGRSVSLSKDEYKLDRWCDNYELKMGVIRSPERRAKFAALDQGRDPPRRKKQPKHHNDPILKAAQANDNKTARDRAQALKEGIASYQARLKKTQDEAWKRRKQEEKKLWNDYRTARQAIRARHQFEIDKIYKYKRNRHALPLSIQGFRDWKETKEWKKLMARLKAEKRRFEYRERTLFGFVSNAIGLVRPGMIRTGKGLLPVLFNLLVSGKARRELLLVKQGLASKALSEKHFGKRKVRADRIRLVRDAQLAALSGAYDIQKDDLDRRHAREIEEQKLGWKTLSAERKRLWEEWHAEFGQTQGRQRTDRGSSDQGSGGNGRAPSPAPPRARDHFPDAPRKPSPGRAADPNKPVEKPAPKPANSRAKGDFTPAAKPEDDPPKPGWKRRRSAAERKADGSYKPRNRKGPTPTI